MSSTDNRTKCTFQVGNQACCFNIISRKGVIQTVCSKHYIPPDEDRCICATNKSTENFPDYDRCKNEIIGVYDKEDLTRSLRIKLCVCTYHFNKNMTFNRPGLIHSSIPEHQRQRIIELMNQARDMVSRDCHRIVTRDRCGYFTKYQGVSTDALQWQRLGQSPPSPFVRATPPPNHYWDTRDLNWRLIPTGYQTYPPPPPPPVSQGPPILRPSSETEVDCAVCLETFSGNQCIRLPCNHMFCSLCIIQVSNRVCPMCRHIF